MDDAFAENASSHGRTALNRFLMGSVSEGVVRDVKCSVEIVRRGPIDAAIH